MRRLLSGLYRAGIPLFLYFLLENAAYLCLLAVSGLLLPGELSGADEAFLISVLVCCFCIPVFLSWYRKDGREGRRPLDRSGALRVRTCVRAVLLFLIVFQGLTLLLNLVPLIPEDPVFQATAEIMEQGSLPLLILTTGVLAPVSEELLFRGLVLSRMRAFLPDPAALFCSALLFGIFHGNLTQGIFAFFCGLLLGAAFLHTDALLLCILMHMAGNLSGVLFLLLSF